MFGGPELISLPQTRVFTAQDVTSHCTPIHTSHLTHVTLSSDDLVPAKTPSSRNHAWYNKLRQSSCLTDETKEGETHNITLPREEVERMKEVLLRRQGLRHSSYQSSLMMALTNDDLLSHHHSVLKFYLK